MSFKEVQSLEADVTISIGKKDKKTGKPFPKQAEGYYLGKREVKTNRGMSNLHFLQTENGNLGVWGTTDMDRKLGGVTPGTMVRVTSTGTRPTPNGDMYVYKVETDSDNTIDVAHLSAGSSKAAPEEYGTEDNDDNADDSDNDGDAVALAAAERQAKINALLNGTGKNKSK